MCIVGLTKLSFLTTAWQHFVKIYLGVFRSGVKLGFSMLVRAWKTDTSESEKCASKTNVLTMFKKLVV